LFIWHKTCIVGQGLDGQKLSFSLPKSAKIVEENMKILLDKHYKMYYIIIEMKNKRGGKNERNTF
jgi:hypothetical protein